ncbi:MAG TPA: NUDIX domain-containing protein, partial [Steroidobacteraceae bacterium]|nr:NUDIX domain-containing protein [Steroidobacteraceae bacterium]
DGSVLLQRRPARGVWSELWTPPEFADLESAQAFCARSGSGAPDTLPPVRHAFTHFDLTITPLRMLCATDMRYVPAAAETALVAPAALPGAHAAALDDTCADACVREPLDEVQPNGVLWYNARQPARVGIPAPIATLLERISPAAPATSAF